MTYNPTEAQTKRWKKEAIALINKKLNESETIEPNFIGGYISACTKMQEEIDSLRGYKERVRLTGEKDLLDEIQKLKEEIEMYKAAFMLADEKWQESVKDIEKIKAEKVEVDEWFNIYKEIEKRDKLLDRAEYYIDRYEANTPLIHVKENLKQWQKEFEELKK